MTDTTDPVVARWLLTRRAFLAAGGAAGVSTYLTALDGPARLAARLLAAPNFQGSFVAQVRRRSDFLHLDFDFFNIQLDTTDPAHPVLDRISGVLDANVIVYLPPQHLLEHTYIRTEDGGDLLDPPPVPARIAGQSRLGFFIPNDRFPMPYDVATLLDWEEWIPQVVGAAVDPGFLADREIREPEFFETALELSYFLLLSPRLSERWEHPTAAPTLDERTDLWETTLAPRAVGGSIPINPSIQAVWALDTGFATWIEDDTRPPTQTNEPFPRDHAPLNQRDRYDIVQNTSVGRLASAYTPTPLVLDRLSLSALGATIDGRGQWDSPVNSLIEWSQRGTLGRDHFVRLVNRGYLFPFGTPAVLIRISEREFNNVGLDTIAYLREREFLVVRRGAKALAGAPLGQRDGGRGLPFTAVEVTTHVTPLLDTHDPIEDLDAGEVFLPHVNGEPFRFHLVGTDRAGTPVEVTSPLVFVEEFAARNSTKMGTLRDWYNGLAVDDDRRVSKAGGQRVAIADSLSTDDTAQEVTSFAWGAEGLLSGITNSQLKAADQPRFTPVASQTRVRLTAAEQVSGRDLGGIDIEYDPDFLADGFVGNPGGLYARTLTPAPVAYPGERSGAVITPDFVVQGLSRVIGPVSGNLGEIRDGTFNAVSFFEGTDAKILGAIPLAEIVEENLDLTEAPTITSVQNGDTVTTRMRFAPTLKADGIAGTFSPYDDDGNLVGSLVIDAKVVTSQSNPLDSTTEIDGDMRNFTVHLLGTDFPLIDLHFRRLRFHSETGQRGTVEPEIDQVAFAPDGVLHFLEQLKEFLSFGDSGPSIEITPTEVSALVSVPIPSIEVGVFSMQNLAFSAGIVIPFSSDPARVRFDFCSREDPFLLTVMIFGGGGWCGLALGLDGFESFEIGLEFGAGCSIDLGVASGSIEIMAGIYFLLYSDTSGGEEARIEGYLRMYGEVEVMGGVASVSLEAYLGFSYDSGTNKVGGEATVTLTVSVLCFSGSVTAHIERHFGGEGDPTFGQFMPPDEGDPDHSQYWDQYCAAFAPSLPQ